jgi:phosphopantetheine attachment domain protein
MEETKKVIIDIMSKYFKEMNLYEYFSQNDDLLAINLNSLIFIRIVIDLEEVLGIEFEDEGLDFEQFSSLEKLVIYINKLLR